MGNRFDFTKPIPLGKESHTIPTESREVYGTVRMTTGQNALAIGYLIVARETTTDESERAQIQEVIDTLAAFKSET